MPSIVHIANPYAIAGAGPYPPSGVQFGDKFFICRGDQRPYYLQASLQDSTIKAYNCGIKAPTAYPAVASSGVTALNITYDEDFAPNNVLYIGYAYYSSVRGVFSQVSPLTAFDMNSVFGSAAAVKKLTIGGFFYPRDDAATQDIDTIVVGVQYGVANGVMCVLPELSVSVAPGDFATASITFDLSVAQLENGGFDLLALSDFVEIPPATKYIERFGERLFYAGQREIAELSQVGLAAVKAALTGTVTVTNGGAAVTGSGTIFQTELMDYDYLLIQGVVYAVLSVTNDTALTLTANYGGTTASTVKPTRLFRGEGVARMELTVGIFPGFLGFDDSHYHMNVFANGQFLGTIFDVVNPYVAYLDRDVSANISETTGFYFTGNNDRIIPSCYTNETSDNFPTPIPECVQLSDARPLTQAVDQGQTLEGVAADGEFLYTLFNDTVVQMLGGGELNHDFNPVFRPLTGRVGAIAPGSICKDNVGRIAWVGEEGICLGDSGGVDSLAHQIGCNLLFGKAPQWIDKTTLAAIQMTYSRQYDGFVWGGFSIDPGQLTGVLLCTYNQEVVVGNGTRFASELVVNQFISIDGLPYQVLEITDDTNMRISTFLGSSNVHFATTGMGRWALLSLRPQLGVWLFDGLVSTSNFLEYQDDNGQGVVLAGGNDRGRLWRVLTPDVYTDVQRGSSDDVYAYQCYWREGWRSSGSGQISTLDAIRINGIIVYGATVTLTLSHWHSNFPLRQFSTLTDNDLITEQVTEDQLPFNIDLQVNQATRYHSMAVLFDSQYYDDDVAHQGPVEITRLTSILGTAG